MVRPMTGTESGAVEHPRESFDRSASDYDDHVAHNQAGAQRLIGALPSGDYDDVLDVACGTGFATLQVLGRHAVRSVTGIDASAGMLEQFARKLSAYPDVRSELRVADVLAMGIPDASKDLVVCTMALHWFDDRRAAIQAMARTLRPGGVFALLGPGPGHDAQFVTLSRTASPPILPELADSIVSNEIYPDEMRGYLAAAGLEPIDLWLEHRERFVTPERYLDRMRAVASHLWAHRSPEERDVQLARASAALRDAGSDGIFRYEFTKLFVIARLPGAGS
jgi:ubiquinone/menaquinone biosynthesis C-methylase UbiE